MSVSLTAGVCLPRRIGTLSLLSQIFPGREWLRGLLTFLDMQGALLGVEASLEGMEQNDDLVECGCSLKEYGSVDRRGG